MIHLPSNTSSLSTYYYSFHLYNILKEPIPFKIQCKILTNDPQYFVNNTNCSSLIFIDNNENQLSRVKNKQRNFSYILVHSSPVTVRRQVALDLYERDKSYISSNLLKQL